MQSNPISPALTQNTPQKSPKLPKIKPLFLTKTQWRRLLPSDIVYINKYRPKMLKTLEITDHHDGGARTQGIRNLRRALIDAKIVSSLIIGNKHWINFPQPQNYLGALLRSSNHYKKLFLRIQDQIHRKALGENAAKTLARLRRCKDLSSLEIHFSCNEETKNRVITHLSSQLRGHKKLKILHLDTNNCRSITFQGAPPDYDPNATLLKFKYPRCLSSLTLNFEGAVSITQKNLSSFILNLQRCNQLKSLNLNSYSIQASYDPAPLFKNSSNSLKTLTLTKKFTEQNIHSFLEDFSHLKHLTTLDLQILSHLTQNQFALFIKTLYNHLASFPDFKSLTLRVSSGTDLPPKFQTLFPPLQSLTKLEQLVIGLPGVADLDYSHLKSLSQALEHLHCLKKLDLSFDSKNISFEGISSLAQGFQNLHSLRDISLNFPYANFNFNFNNKSLHTISNCLANLPLRNLSFNLGESSPNMLIKLWKEKPKFTPLFSALYGFNLLTDLYLNLSAFNLSTAQAKHFSLALKELKQLCKLTVALREFDPGNKYQGVKSFFASLKQIPKLSSLALSFLGKIKDEEVRSLVENLQGCQGLRDLYLGFHDADKLTEESLHYLSIGLRGLFLLKELRLSFERKKAFRNESIFKLLEGLTILKYLENFHLWNNFPPTAELEIKKFARDMVEKQRFKRLIHFMINWSRI